MDLWNKASSFEWPEDLILRPNPRNRKIRLSHRTGSGFLLTYPPRTPKKHLAKFVSGQAVWMDTIRSKNSASHNSLKSYLEANPILEVNGLIWGIEITGGKADISNFEADQSIVLNANDSESEWVTVLQKASREPLAQMLYAAADQVGVRVKSVQIRNQKSRWGSCSGTGTISLNWRLILMPPPIQRHIILHELAHLRHLNHSEEFWKQLEAWDTKSVENRRLLKQRGKDWIHLGHQS